MGGCSLRSSGCGVWVSGPWGHQEGHYSEHICYGEGKKVRLMYRYFIQLIRISYTIGTGITPMLQLIRHAIRDSGDDIQMALLFANQVCSLLL